MGTPSNTGTGSGPVYPVTVPASGFAPAITGLLAGNLSAEHTDWLLLVGEFVFVFILAMIADASPAAATTIVAFLLGLWLLWLTLGSGSAVITGALAAMGLDLPGAPTSNTPSPQGGFAP